MTRTELLTLLDQKLRDVNAYIDESERITLLEEAVAEYNKYRPNSTLEDQSGTDDNELVLPTSWEENFSRIITLEEVYEKGTDDESFTILEPRLYSIYEKDTGKVIRLENYTYSDYTYRITFTVQHTLPDGECSVPEHNCRALLYYATSQGLLDLSTYTAQNADHAFTGLENVTLQRKTQSEQYYRNSEKYRQKWCEFMGIPFIPSNLISNNKLLTTHAMTRLTWNYHNAKRLLH